MPNNTITIRTDDFAPGPEGMEQVRRAFTAGIRAVLACQQDRLIRDGDVDNCIFLVYLLEATFSDWQQKEAE